jgi:hypothetical protein
VAELIRNDPGHAGTTLSNGARANQSSVFSLYLDNFISRISKYAISFYLAIVMWGDTEMIGSPLR